MSCTARVQGEAQDKPYFSSIQRAAEAALDEAATDPCEVTIALVDEGRMRDLNRRYAGTDEVTDVLSFESGARDPASDRVILGDIAICLPVARGQAERGGHTLEAELALLTVHGALHLLGYDHATPADRGRMWARQRAVLDALGYAQALPSEPV